MARTETISFNDFMAGDSGVYGRHGKRSKAAKVTKGKREGFAKLTAPIAGALALPATPAFAESGGEVAGEVVAAGAISDAIKSRITDAFDPVIELMIALSLPVAGVMITGGALMVMIGMNDRGYGLLMKAGIGYILVQMSPLFIDLLAGIGQAV